MTRITQFHPEIRYGPRFRRPPLPGLKIKFVTSGATGDKIYFGAFLITALAAALMMPIILPV